MTTWFIDTNVFLYLKDPHEPAKAAICGRWLSAIQASGNLLLVSPQVINEVFANLLKWSSGPENHRIAEDFARTLLAWCDARIDKDVIGAAFDMRRRSQLSWWDAVLIASAIQGGADMILTEDLNDGQRYGPLQALNPFRHAPEDVLGRAT